MSGYKLLKVELNRAAVGALLKGGEVAGVINRKAGEIANRCGAGFEVKSFTGFDRAHATVRAVTPEARQECLNENTLLRNMY